jgi:hypothetical protein
LDNDEGYNPLVAGDDDGTVAVSSTRLPGATDSGVVRAAHSFLPGNERVIEQTLRFLRSGNLRERGPRQPIPRN